MSLFLSLLFLFLLSLSLSLSLSPLSPLSPQAPHTSFALPQARTATAARPQSPLQPLFSFPPPAPVFVLLRVVHRRADVCHGEPGLALAVREPVGVGPVDAAVLRPAAVLALSGNAALGGVPCGAVRPAWYTSHARCFLIGRAGVKVKRFSQIAATFVRVTTRLFCIPHGVVGGHGPVGVRRGGVLGRHGALDASPDRGQRRRALQHGSIKPL